MKKLFLLFMLPISVRAQSVFIENRNVLRREDEKMTIEPVLHGDALFPVSKILSLGVYAEVEKELWEAIPLAEFKIMHIEFGAGLGYQSTGHARGVTSFQWKTEKNNVFYFGEHGPDDYWYHAYYDHRFTKVFGAGVVAQQYAGIGPRLSVKLPWHFGLWGSFCYDPGSGREQKTAWLFGVRFHYENEREEESVAEENQ